MEGQTCYRKSSAGRIEHRMQEVVRDMTTGALGALASHGVLLSDREQTNVQRAIHEAVTRSVEIEAAVAMVVEREKGKAA